jgi:N6-L-threonylcarbamoyladenine synthase
VNELSFSLSGLENKVQEYYFDTKNRENTAFYALFSVISAFERVTKNAKEMYGDIPVLFAGGVSSNLLLREVVQGIYPEPRFSVDNAMGIAILAYRQVF